jgi:hypothetical protein
MIRLFDFVHRVHSYGVQNPGSGMIQRFRTPQAISDVNSLLRVGRFNSVRANIRSSRQPVKANRRIK